MCGNQRNNVNTVSSLATVSRRRKWLIFKPTEGSWDSLLKSKTKHLPQVSQRLGPLPDGHLIPPELIIQIIHHLREDKSILAKCCLVSQAWLDICRRHLYYEVKVTVDVKARTFSSVLKSLEVFRRAWKHIKVLVLRGRPFTRPAMCIHLLKAIVEKLDNLESLHIRNVRFIHTTPRFTRNFRFLFNPTALRGAPSSKTLSNACIFNHLDDIDSVPFSQSKPHTNYRPIPIALEHLAINSAGVKDDPVFPFRETLTLFSSYRRFDSLITCYSSSGTLPEEYSEVIHLTEEQELLWNIFLRFESASVSFTSKPPSYKTLDSLGIGCAYLEQFSAASELLHKTNMGLRRFCIDPTSMYEDGQITEPIDWNQLSLSRFERLQSVSLIIDYTILVTYQPHTVLDGSARFLCRYPAELLSVLPLSIERISIGIRLRLEDVDSFMMFVDWDHLQTQFCKFPELEKVEFVQIQYDADPGDSKSAKLKEIGIKESLPMIHGILRIVDKPALTYHDFFLSSSLPSI
ncbi:hypothetical protein ABKN59_011786 [Abortiporus biennis]